MPDINIDGGWLALIGTIFGGAGLKIIEAWLGKAKQRQDHGAQIREELRKEVIGLREELAKSKVEELRLETEVEAWRSKYYDQFVTISEKTTQLTIAQDKIIQLKATLDSLKTRIAELEKKMGETTTDE